MHRGDKRNDNFRYSNHLEEILRGVKKVKTKKGVGYWILGWTRKYRVQFGSSAFRRWVLHMLVIGQQQMSQVFAVPKVSAFYCSDGTGQGPFKIICNAFKVGRLVSLIVL